MLRPGSPGAGGHPPTCPVLGARRHFRSREWRASPGLILRPSLGASQEWTRRAWRGRGGGGGTHRQAGGGRPGKTTPPWERPRLCGKPRPPRRAPHLALGTPHPQASTPLALQDPGCSQVDLRCAMDPGQATRPALPGDGAIRGEMAADAPRGGGRERRAVRSTTQSAGGSWPRLHILPPAPPAPGSPPSASAPPGGLCCGRPNNVTPRENAGVC